MLAVQPTVQPTVKRGRKPGSGRKKGVPNKSTQQMRELFQQHGPDALQVLVGIMSFGVSEAARITAAREVLDRAYGKVAQPVEVADARLDMTGWSKQRIAAFNDISLENFEAVQERLKDEF